MEDWYECNVSEYLSDCVGIIDVAQLDCGLKRVFDISSTFAGCTIGVTRSDLSQKGRWHSSSRRSFRGSTW